MNFVSKLKLDHQSACIAVLKRFSPVNRIGVYGVINVSLANYIGDCQVLNNMINDHIKDNSDDTNCKKQLIVDIDNLFLCNNGSDVHEYLLTTLPFDKMLVACTYLATQHLTNGPIKTGSKAALAAIATTENISADDLKKIIRHKHEADNDALARINTIFDQGQFYQCLVMREQLEILLSYAARFNNYRIQAVQGIALSAIPSDDEIALTTKMAYKCVGLNEPVCISQVIRMTNIFTSQTRSLFHDIVVHLLDIINSEITTDVGE